MPNLLGLENIQFMEPFCLMNQATTGEAMRAADSFSKQFTPHQHFEINLLNTFEQNGLLFRPVLKQLRREQKEQLSD